MEHRERYLELLSPSTRGRLLAAIREQGFFEKLKIIQASVINAEPLPYLRFDLESDPNFVAQSGGLLLDLHGVVDDPPPTRYYLPYVGLTPKAQPTDEVHELTHVADLLELLRREPGFAVEAEHLSMCNISNPDLLESSIHFEVSKVFMLEVSAFGHEFDKGTRDIDVPIKPGATFKYHCDSRKEFIRLWLASYLVSMQQMYVTRFPQHVQRIQKAFEAATDEQGCEVFGDQPWARFKEEWDDLPSRIVVKILCQLADRQTVTFDN